MRRSVQTGVGTSQEKSVEDFDGKAVSADGIV